MAVAAVVGQKGGVGKSTLSRLIAREAAAAGWAVVVADLDMQQLSTLRWAERRAVAGIKPMIDVMNADSAAAAIALAQGAAVDLVVVDAPARASAATLDLARAADVVLQPASPSLDDLRPAVVLYQELVRAGISREKLAVVLTSTETAAEERDARSYVEQAGFVVLPGSIPHRPLYRQAQNGGKTLSEVGPVSLRKRVRQVAEAIAARLQG